MIAFYFYKVTTESTDKHIIHTSCWKTLQILQFILFFSCIFIENFTFITFPENSLNKAWYFISLTHSGSEMKLKRDNVNLFSSAITSGKLLIAKKIQQ